MIQVLPKTIEAYKLLEKGSLAFARAERQGIYVDVPYIISKKKKLSKKIQNLEDELKTSKFYRRWAHIKNNPNIYSDTQLRNYLYNTLKLKPINETKTGQGSTDEESLKALKIPELDKLLEIRKLKKIRDTYLEGFLREQVDGIMHPSFNLNLVKTFRSSSNNPNFQNIPKRDYESMKICRRAILPRPNHQLLEADFSGIEVRIAACYHNDSNMLKYINDPKSDMHGDMAKQIFKLQKFDKSIEAYNTLRQAAKNGFVFPQFYGDYYKNCAINMCEWGKLPQKVWKSKQGIEFEGEFLSDHLIKNKIKSFDKFVNHVQDIEEDFWNNRFPEYKAWKDRWWEMYKKYGYIVMKTGFQCSGVMGKNDCINYPVQGAAFHCLLWSFIEIDRIMREEGWDSRLVGQIHDSIIIDLNPKELDHVIKIIKKVTCEDLLKHWDWIIVPMDIDIELCGINKSWDTKKEI